jgi:hypothetical protein
MAAVRPEGKAVGEVILGRAGQVDQHVLHRLQVGAAEPCQFAVPVRGVEEHKGAVRHVGNKVGGRGAGRKSQANGQALLPRAVCILK